MVCVNQTWSHFIIQMAKTYSKLLATRHGRVTLWYVCVSLYCSTWGRETVRLQNWYLSQTEVSRNSSASCSYTTEQLVTSENNSEHGEPSSSHFLQLLLLALATLTCALPHNFRTGFLTKRYCKETSKNLNGLLQHSMRSVHAVTRAAVCSTSRVLLCFGKCPQPFPKRAPHTVRAIGSSFNFHCSLISSRSSSRVYVFFLVFPSLLSSPLSFFLSKTCFRWLFIRIM